MVDSINKVDPASLPMPNSLLGGDDPKASAEYPVEHLSVIFNQKEQN